MPADRITSVRAMVVSEATATTAATSTVTDPPGEQPIGADPAGVEDPDRGAVLEHWITGKIAHPMSRYAEFRQHRSPGIAPNGGEIIVVVESESGQVGIASTAGGRAVAAVVDDLLAGYVIGESAFAHERIWDRMTSATLRFGRAGLVMHGVSAIDNAIWDLHGQIHQRPVVELLGGSVDDAVEVYTTGPRPDIGKALGFAAAKLPLTWAPCEGEEGFVRNVETAREARAAVGEGFPLLYDCWMSLDVDYAARLADAVDELGFTWIEEPLQPHDYAGHRRLRDRMPARMQLATGEHEYTAAGFRRLCEAGVDVVQPDPAWCGGMTELIRIAAVAEAQGVRLVPHAGGLLSYHFVASRPELQLAEYPLLSLDGDAVRPQHAPLFVGENLPVDGWVTLPNAPGFGLVLGDDVQLEPALPALAGSRR